MQMHRMIGLIHEKSGTFVAGIVCEISCHASSNTSDGFISQVVQLRMVIIAPRLSISSLGLVLGRYLQIKTLIELATAVIAMQSWAIHVRCLPTLQILVFAHLLHL